MTCRLHLLSFSPRKNYGAYNETLTSTKGNAMRHVKTFAKYGILSLIAITVLNLLAAVGIKVANRTRYATN